MQKPFHTVLRHSWHNGGRTVEATTAPVSAEDRKQLRVRWQTPGHPPTMRRQRRIIEQSARMGYGCPRTLASILVVPPSGAASPRSVVFVETPVSYRSSSSCRCALYLPPIHDKVVVGTKPSLIRDNVQPDPRHPTSLALQSAILAGDR